MKKQLAICSVLGIALVLLLPVAPVAAKGPRPDDGITIINEDHTLGPGEAVNGDLVVFNGDATLETGSRVTGSVFVWSGDADISGTVDGDLVVAQGSIYLTDDATVAGDVVCTWGCDLDREDGARVDGNVVEGSPVLVPQLVPLPDMVPLPEIPSDLGPTRIVGTGVRSLVGWVFRIVRAFAAMVVLAVVAGVVAVVLPRQTAEAGRTTLSAPGQSLGIGILTVIAGVVVTIGLAITICFSPLAVLLALALGIASLFGWIAIGHVVGQRLLEAAGAQDPAPVWSAALGTLLISMVTMFVGVVGVSCLNVIASAVSVIVGFVGLGAVVLSRFGTRPYQRSGATSASDEPDVEAATESETESETVSEEAVSAEAREDREGASTGDV